jgi:Winged helix DNA-binding domain
MKRLDIALQRLHNQRLSLPDLKNPSDPVKWLGAVQAQDYYGAKWALAQRMQGVADEAIEKAFADGAILRTHVMRPTWHFVAPADIRWMLELTAPHVNTAMGYYYRELGLNDALLRRSNKAIAVALQGGRQLTRAELQRAVERAGIDTGSSRRFGHILGRAELDGVICSGARKGKQFTYALLDERAPKTKNLARDEALAKLTQRYFTSRGPATLQDFGWWSGLTVADIKAGIEMVQQHLAQEKIDGQTYWFPRSESAIRPMSQTAYLLPSYDEYLIGYKDRSATLDAADGRPSRGNPVFSSTIVIGGRIVGGWNRILKKSSVIISVRPFAPFSKTQKRAILAAADRYGAFLGLKSVLHEVEPV